MLFSRSIYTKTYRSIIAKIPNPSNPLIGEPVKLSDGSRMFEIKRPEAIRNYDNCPVMPYRGGEIVRTPEFQAKIENDAASGLSIGQLCKRYGITRSYALNKIKAGDLDWKAEDERVSKLSLKQKRGLVLRRLIKIDRFRSF